MLKMVTDTHTQGPDKRFIGDPRIHSVMATLTLTATYRPAVNSIHDKRKIFSQTQLIFSLYRSLGVKRLRIRGYSSKPKGVRAWARGFGKRWVSTCHDMWLEWRDAGGNARVTAHLTMLIQPQDLYGVEWHESSTYKNRKVRIRTTSFGLFQVLTRSSPEDRQTSPGQPVPRSRYGSILRYNLLVKEAYWKIEADHAARTEQTWNSYTVKAVKLATLVKRPRFDGTGKFLWYYTWPLLHNLATLNLAQSFKLSTKLYTQVQTPSVGRPKQPCRFASYCTGTEMLNRRPLSTSVDNKLVFPEGNWPITVMFTDNVTHRPYLDPLSLYSELYVCTCTVAHLKFLTATWFP